MAGPDGRCILFNSLRSCPFAREVAPFYVAIAMLLNTVTITLTSSPTSCFTLLRFLFCDPYGVFDVYHILPINICLET